MVVNPHKLKKSELVKFTTGYCRHRHRYYEHPNCFIEEQMYKPRVGYLDIETSHLKANFGVMLSYCIKVDGKREILGNVITKKELHHPDMDKWIVKKCINDMMKFDELITYNGTRFDIPFIRTRALIHGLDFPIYGSIKHKDAYYMAKGRLCLHRKNLETVSYALGIPGKNHVDGNLWMKASMHGDKKALEYIYDHNRRDVVVLEKVYKALKEYIREVKRSI